MVNHERDSFVRVARVYLAEARARRNSEYKHQRLYAVWLLEAAGNSRRRALLAKNSWLVGITGDLFN